jgi:DNA-binding PadR family transcriptional regulator
VDKSLEIAMPVENKTLRPAVFHILLSLSAGDMHGLGIAETIDEATGGTVLLGPGTLYRSLKEMARDGLIREAPRPEDADPRRRFYAITELGREVVGVEATRMARIVEIAHAHKVLPGSL